MCKNMYIEFSDKDKVKSKTISMSNLMILVKVKQTYV